MVTLDADLMALGMFKNTEENLSNSGCKSNCFGKKHTQTGVDLVRGDIELF
jgi:hypothetical protein